MALEVFSDPLDVSQFQSLEEYQSSTPATFFDGKPVLHYHNPTCTLAISTEALASNHAFQSLKATTDTSEPDGNVNGTSSSDQTDLRVQAWITSSHFTLFSSDSSKGLRIPYPSISLHAQQGQGLYMQLILSDMRHTSDDELETLELVLTPSQSSSTSTGGESDAEPVSTESEIAGLYAAVSACADLHPDPDPDDDDAGAGGSMMTMLMAGAGDVDLGSAGWITAENMHEHMDGEGNVVFDRGDGQGGTGDQEGEGLGAGAGQRRGADDDEAEADEVKWRRTG
ncbi:hypothetical protein CAC42_241 [Sphaceloma murrayae]|uniref:Regulator of volume decrease after cellular swelling-domain-containing protein n=1 Tax=Sphaceloma murrayae TaxID=2082308 RepID=A0A2K1QMZ2_9PEZI|nr:hypothetical protein CAC42_241 [Sphaceloma murrayae]